MTNLNAKPPTDCAVSGGGSGTVINNSDARQTDIITKTPLLSRPRRRLDPKIGALASSTLASAVYTLPTQPAIAIPGVGFIWLGAGCTRWPLAMGDGQRGQNDT